MNTKHTPGPWFVWAPRPERWPRHTIRAAGEQYVAEVVIHAQNPASADAALISAAPTMLDVLREATTLMGYYRPHDKYPDGSIISGPSEEEVRDDRRPPARSRRLCGAPQRRAVI